MIQSLDKIKKFKLISSDVLLQLIFCKSLFFFFNIYLKCNYRNSVIGSILENKKKNWQNFEYKSTSIPTLRWAYSF